MGFESVCALGLGPPLEIGPFSLIVEKRHTIAARGLHQVEPSLGSVETISFPEASFDAAYSRWLFCWLRDPQAVLALVARALRPGGVVVLQEYLDWAAMKHVPRDQAFDRAVAACMRSWAEGGGRIDIAEEIPSLARGCGLALEHFEPGGLDDVGLQFGKTLQVFAIVLVPVAIGMLVRRRRPAFADRADKPVRIASAVVLVLVIAGALLSEREDVDDLA